MTQIFNRYCSISSSLSIVHGVPQGSVLGPILFLIYINNLCNGQFEGSLTCFADDTALSYSSENSLSLFQSIQNDLDKLRYWFITNRMVLSVKTKYINFSLRSKDFGNNRLFFKCKSCLILGSVGCNSCVEIEQVKHIKYLG